MARLVVYYGSAAIVLLSVIVIVVAIIWGAMRYRRLRCSYYLVTIGAAKELTDIRLGERPELSLRRGHRVPGPPCSTLSDDQLRRGAAR